MLRKSLPVFIRTGVWGIPKACKVLVFSVMPRDKEKMYAFFQKARHSLHSRVYESDSAFGLCRRTQKALGVGTAI
jgi:hypothetical protein